MRLETHAQVSTSIDHEGGLLLSGELPLTYLPLDSFSLSLSLYAVYSLFSYPFLHLYW
jgi:hypothetical protein